MPPVGIDERRLAIEIIATLVHIKRTMADMILKPAGVPLSAYQSNLYKRDDVTGRLLSKRQIAPLILDALQALPKRDAIIRNLIRIAAEWDHFHLADDEYKARATTQKARELLHEIELMEAREERQREIARRQELARLEKERVKLLDQQSSLLLAMFDSLTTDENPQKRGFLLQDLLNRLFQIYEIPVIRSFTRNDGAEQIDGAFKLDGWHYLLECRWRKKLADTRELDGLSGQVARSGRQTMGLFLSINGWSSHVPELLKQNPDKSIILMDGYDLRCVLHQDVDFRALLLAKISSLSLRGEPFLSVPQYISTSA